MIQSGLYKLCVLIAYLCPLWHIPERTRPRHTFLWSSVAFSRIDKLFFMSPVVKFVILLSVKFKKRCFSARQGLKSLFILKDGVVYMKTQFGPN